MEKRKPIYKIRWQKTKGSPTIVEMFEAALFADRLAEDSHYLVIGLDRRFRLRINGKWFIPQTKDGTKIQYAFFTLPEIKELIWRAITNEIES